MVIYTYLLILVAISVSKVNSHKQNMIWYCIWGVDFDLSRLNTNLTSRAKLLLLSLRKTDILKEKVQYYKTYSSTAFWVFQIGIRNWRTRSNDSASCTTTSTTSGFRFANCSAIQRHKSEISTEPGLGAELIDMEKDYSFFTISVIDGICTKFQKVKVTLTMRELLIFC